MPLVHESATLWWADCSLCIYIGVKMLDQMLASIDLGNHMDAEHPGWASDMQKLRNGIDLNQQTLDLPGEVA